MVEVASGVGEVFDFEAEALLEGEVEVAEERCVFLVAGDGEVLTVGESAAGDEGGEVLIGVSGGVAHAGADEDDGVVEEGFAGDGFLFAELLEKTGEAVDVGGFDGDEVADHVGVVSVVGEAVVAGAEGAAVERKDLAEAIEEE